ncbi:hypothetical protein OAS39_03900, partial [Pirellulales bacterium]|nr:hypothetical protein [Pirellulales bacterium]
MSTAGLLAEAVSVAQESGIRIREDHLDGAGGGHCLIHGVKWLLLDVTQALEEQLNDAIDALRAEATPPPSISPELARLMGTPSS